MKPKKDELTDKDFVRLTPMRVRVLDTLLRGDMTLVRIHKRVPSSKAGLFESLEVMQESGFISKDKNTVYKLTPKGKSLILALRSVVK